jgi:hypothetical protein
MDSWEKKLTSSDKANGIIFKYFVIKICSSELNNYLSLTALAETR